MKKLLLIMIIAIALIIPSVIAQYPPVDFHQFYGDVRGAKPAMKK